MTADPADAELPVLDSALPFPSVPLVCATLVTLVTPKSSTNKSSSSPSLTVIVASSFTASVSFIRSAPFPIIVIVKVEVSVPPCVSLVVNVNISVTVSPLLRDAASFAI